MGFFDKLFGKKEPVKQMSMTLPSFFMDDTLNSAYKIYGLTLATTKIANSISLCDFEEYIKSKKVKGHYWYLLNYQPNKNESSADFFSKVIHKMIFDRNGALVYQDKEGEWFVADYYTIEPKNNPFVENIYTDISFNGTFNTNLRLKESDVFVFKYHNGQIKNIVDSIYHDYSKIMNSSIKNYNSSISSKFILNIDSQFNTLYGQVVLDDKGNPALNEFGEQVIEADLLLDEIIQERLGALLSEKDAIVPIEEGLSLENIGSKKGNTKSGTATTKDITDTFKDIVYFCGDALSIPRAYMLGDVADAEAVKTNYIDDAVRPFIEIIDKEINRKLFSESDLANGSKIKIKVSAITTRDPIKFANSAESLLRSGLFTINMLLEMMGEETITDDWADKRFITKNYQTMEELEQSITENVQSAIKKVFK